MVLKRSQDYLLILLIRIKLWMFMGLCCFQKEDKLNNWIMIIKMSKVTLFQGSSFMKVFWINKLKSSSKNQLLSLKNLKDLVVLLLIIGVKEVIKYFNYIFYLYLYYY
jgi:hypothetical protein